MSTYTYEDAQKHKRAIEELEASAGWGLVTAYIEKRRLLCMQAGMKPGSDGDFSHTSARERNDELKDLLNEISSIKNNALARLRVEDPGEDKPEP